MTPRATLAPPIYSEHVDTESSCCADLACVTTGNFVPYLQQVVVNGPAARIKRTALVANTPSSTTNGRGGANPASAAIIRVLLVTTAFDSAVFLVGAPAPCVLAGIIADDARTSTRVANLSRVTIFFGNPNLDMNELLLGFLGAFSHVQTYIDDVLADLFFKQRMPNAADFVTDRVVSRIRDEERTKLVQAIAAELGTDAELDSFNAVYMEVKRLRDRVAHSARFSSSADQVSVTPSYINPAGDGAPEVRIIERAELREAVQKLRWIEAQIMYVLYSSELLTGLFRGDRPLGVVKPTRLPQDWNGVVFIDLQDPGRCTM